MTRPSSFCDTRLKFLNLLLCAEECFQLISANVSNLKHTRFFANLRARLSLLFLSNSMIRFSYGAVLVVSTKLNEEYPQTSLMRDRTALVFCERTPFLREGRGGSSRRRTTCPLFIPTAMPTNKNQHLIKYLRKSRVSFHRCIHHPQPIFQARKYDKYD